MPAEARLPSREPGLSAPGTVLAAARAARRGRRPADAALLRRVRDALVGLSAVTRHYIKVPGDCLASPRVEEP
jgi:hypothetical protein